MDEFYRQALRQILDRHGRAVCDDPRRVRGLLHDEAGGRGSRDDREVNVLVGALEHGAVKELEVHKNLMPVGALLERAAEKLRNKLAMSDEASRWAVETWALALGLNV